MLDNQTNTKQNIPWPTRDEHNIGENHAPGPRKKARCIAEKGCYYDFNRRYEGDTFIVYPVYMTETDPRTFKPIMENGQPKKKIITAEEQLKVNVEHGIWEEVPLDEPTTLTTAQQALNNAQDEITKANMPVATRGPRGRSVRDDA
jgi:hypothetical protein